jgi:hypothetical protein
MLAAMTYLINADNTYNPYMPPEQGAREGIFYDYISIGNHYDCLLCKQWCEQLLNKELQITRTTVL